MVVSGLSGLSGLSGIFSDGGGGGPPPPFQPSFDFSNEKNTMYFSLIVGH